MDIDHEIIAGSEDEYEMPLDTGYGFRAAETSRISAFTNSAPNQPIPNQHSSISNFTNEPLRHTGMAATLDPIDSGFSNPAEDFSPIASIADRAKTRQRKAAPTRPAEPIFDLTSDEGDFIPRSSVPKTKSKPKTKAKAGGAEPPSMAPMSAPMTHDNEMSPNIGQSAATKARPRPRPLFKKPQAIPPVSPSLSTFTALGPDVPIATSPLRPPSQLAPLDLPPSDPIHSSSAQPPFPSEGSRRAGTPSSLFSDAEDYLAPGNEPSPYNEPLARLPHTSNTPPRHPSPPLTFFASSSAPPPREQEPDIVDLTDIPDSQPIKIVIKKSTKTKRKLTDISVQDEDDADDAFDPSSSTKKSKSKEKTKKTRQTKEKNKQPAGAPQVEVVITAKPKKTKAPTKGKGKQKQTVDDAFKSREFVEDTDDEDPIGLRPFKTNPPPLDPVSPSVTNDRPRLSTPQPSPHTSPRTDRSKPTTETPDNESTSHKPRPRTNKRKSIVDSDADEDEEERRRTLDRGNVAKKKRTAKDHGKGGGKNPSVNEHSDDDTMPVQEDTARVSGSTTKPRREVMLSDGDGDAHESLESNGQTPVRKSKGVSNKATTIPDTDDEMDLDKDEGNSKRKDDVHETPKENLKPDVKRTPGLSTVSTRTEDTKSQGSHTPLYMRYEVAPRRSSLPMSELIRRATNTPSTPGPVGPRGRVVSTPSQSATPKLTATPRIYSPYLKASRSVLSQIAPLHPNRRTPPPPPPPPPPKKKTKKELEMEEQWEEELIESVGGIAEWTCLPDDEKKNLRRIKREKEMGNWSD